MGPWLANNIRECDRLTSMMSYWSHFRMCSRNRAWCSGILWRLRNWLPEQWDPKAAFQAFEMLHKVGDQRLMPEEKGALVTRRGSGGAIVVALVELCRTGPDKADTQTFRLKVFESREEKQISACKCVDPTHGSAMTAVWNPAWGNRRLAQSGSRLRRLKRGIEAGAGDVSIRWMRQRFRLRAQGLAIVTIR